MLLINDLTRQDKTLSEKIMGAAQRVLSSGYFVLGSEVESFEHLFARYCGVEHCVSTGNGTDALELAMRALDLPAHSGIALVAYTLLLVQYFPLETFPMAREKMQIYGMWLSFALAAGVITFFAAKMAEELRRQQRPENGRQRVGGHPDPDRLRAPQPLKP